MPKWTSKLQQIKESNQFYYNLLPKYNPQIRYNHVMPFIQKKKYIGQCSYSMKYAHLNHNEILHIELSRLYVKVKPMNINPISEN